MNPIDRIEAEQLRKDVPPFKPGDTVRVHVRVVEGDKERIQVFEGTVIRRSGGSSREMFTVRKTSYGSTASRWSPAGRCAGRSCITCASARAARPASPKKPARADAPQRTVGGASGR